MANYDVLTFSDELEATFLKGQFTIFKNNKMTRYLFLNSREQFLACLSRDKIVPFDETFFSTSVMLNESITFYVQTSQGAGENGLFETYLHWNNGKLNYYVSSIFDAFGTRFPEKKYFSIGFENKWNQTNCIYSTFDHRDCHYTNMGSMDFMRSDKGSSIVMKRSSTVFPISIYHFLRSKEFHFTFKSKPEEHIWNIFISKRRKTVSFLPENF